MNMITKVVRNKNNSETLFLTKIKSGGGVTILSEDIDRKISRSTALAMARRKIKRVR